MRISKMGKLLFAFTLVQVYYLSFQLSLNVFNYTETEQNSATFETNNALNKCMAWSIVSLEQK